MQQTYEISQDRHDPRVGDDALTFGIHVWKSGVLYLGDAVRAIGGSAEVVNQSLSMRIDNVELRHHKLGDTESDNPWTSFPGSTGPASRMPGRAEVTQLEFDLPEDDHRVFYDWVIGSYGNPEDGLRAVRLHAVGGHRALDGSISRWEAVYTLFDVGSTPAVRATPEPLAPAAAAVEVTPEPAVELHPEVSEHNSSGS